MPVDDKTFRRHLAKMVRLNMILAVLSLAAVVSLYIWIRSNVRTDSPQTQTTTVNNQAIPTPTQEANPEIEKQYKEEINTILDGYQFDDSGKADQLLSQVLELHVPEDLKTVQLEVVLALTEAKQSNYESAKQRIDAVQKEYGWFLQ